MLIGIVGLGLIGGSFAKAYAKQGHSVIAYDIDKSILGFSIISGVVQREMTDEDLPLCDLILLCTYPAATLKFMEEKGALITAKPVVIDCCGTKRNVVEKASRIAEKNGFTYVGGHPMAGTQYSGFKYSKDNMFHRAPMAIIPPDYDDIELLEKIKKLLEPAGFSKITITNPDDHDEIIAYTSQLAHIVSSAYIKSPTALDHKGLSAGSYKDMTRVAWLNPDMWTELCIDNRDNLVHELDILIENLKEYRDVLDSNDREGLRELLKRGKQIKELVDGTGR